MTNECFKCKLILSNNNFYKNGQGESLRSGCKKCDHKDRKHKYHSDGNFRKLSLLRSKTYYALKAKNSKCDLFGISVSEYKKWIEYQMSDEMSWDNYGKIWHIDHVIPCWTFNLTDYCDMKRCFNWKNLRPMLKLENKLKGMNIDEDDNIKHCEKAMIYYNQFLL